MSLCNDSIFCKIEQNWRPYIIYYNKLDKNISYVDNYKKYNELIDKVLENKFKKIEDIKEKIIELIVKPPNVKQVQYIFVGELENDYFEKKLKNIEKTNKINKEDLKELNEFFGYNIIDEFKLDNENEKKFIFKLISSDDTVNTLINMIYVYFSTEDEEFLNETIYLFNNKEIDWTPIKRIAVINFNKDQITKKIGLDLEKYLKSLLVPEQIVKKVISKYDNPEKNIEEILNNELIKLFVDIYYRFKCITHEFKQFSIQTTNFDYPIDNYIFNYFDENSQSYKDNIDKDISIKYNIKEDTIGKIASGNNEFYMYNLNNILENILIQKKIEISNTKLLDTYYSHFLGKLFNKVKSKDYSKILKKKSINEIEEYKKVFEKYRLKIDYYHDFNENEINKEIITKYNKIYLINISHKLTFPEGFELKKIFNEFKLNFNVPFVKFRDMNTTEMVYKIFKPITQKEKNDFEAFVPLKQLDEWIKYSKYNFNNGELNELNTQPKEIQYKLLINTRDKGEELKGKIYKINDDGTVDVLNDGYVYNNVNYKLVNKKSELKLEEEVYFKKHDKLYVDIDIFKNGKVLVTLNTKDFNFNEESFIELIDLMIIKINEFINNLYNIDSLRVYKNWIDIVEKIDLYYDRYLNNSSFNNIIYKYEMFLPQDIPVSYSELSNIAKFCSPFVILNDKPLLKDELVDYFDNTEKEWVSCKIVDFNLDGLYTIKLDTGPIKKEIKRQELRSKTIEEKKGTIDLIYKRIPQFQDRKPIEQLIIKLSKAGFSQLMITNSVKEMFDITEEEAYKFILDILKRDSVKELDKLDAELGVNITIDYSTEDKKDKNMKLIIYIQNVKSIEYIPAIHKFILFFISLYITNLKRNKKDYLYPLIENKIDLEEIEKQEEIINNLNDKIDKTKKTQSFDEIDFDDFEFLLDDDIDNNDEDEIDDKDVKVNELKENIEESKLKKIQQERKLELSSGQDGRTDNNPILKRLYLVDDKLFKWKEIVDKKEKTYYSTCQGISRYPKVLTDEEKEEIDRDHPGSYSVDPNKIESCETFEDITNNMKRYNNKVKCSTVKWGSNNRNKQWYICPRIYDIKEGIPLNVSDLTFEEPFTPKNVASINDWRVDKKTGRDILTFNPTYNGRKLIQDIESYNPHKNYTILIIKKGVDYLYPGFQKSPTVPVIYSPCCFGTSMRVKEAFLVSSEEEGIKKSNDYIQSWGKTLDYNPPRIGLLPAKLYDFLNIDSNACKNGDFSKSKKCFFRRGIKQDHNSFLSLIANIKGDNWTDEKIINNIIKHLTFEEFKTLNNGNLNIQFKGISEESGYQQYLEYLISNEKKDYKFFYDYLTKPNKWLFEFGIKLIIIEVYTEGDDELFRVLCPYFMRNRITYGQDTPVVLAIKDNSVYEPIYYFDGNPKPIKELNINDKKIKEIYKLFSQKCDKVYPSKILNLQNSKIEFLFDKKYNLHETLAILNKLDYSFQPKFLVIDNYNKITSIYLKNNLFVPIYPENSTDLKNKIISYYELDEENLLNLIDTLQNYYLLEERTGGRINIRPYQYFYNNKNNINGFLSNTGIYLPVKETKINKKIKEQLNFYEIDKSIKEYDDKVTKLKFKEKNNLAELNDILDKIQKKYNTNLFKINKYVVNKNEKIDAVVLNNDILIPIDEINIENISKSKLITDFKVENYEKYIDDSYELSRISDYRIKCIPISGILNNKTKEYIGILIESNYNIYFEDIEKFNITDKLGNDYKILKLIQHDLIYKTINTKMFDKTINMDKRQLSVQKLKYLKEMYEIIKYELHLFIHDNDNRDLLFFLSTILNLNAISSDQKKFIIYPLISLSLDSILKLKIDDNTRYPKLNEFLTCNSGDGCNNNELCAREITGEINKVKKVDDYIFMTANKKLNASNLGRTVLKYIEQGMNLYNNIIENRRKKIFCKTRFIDSIDLIGLKNMKNKIVEECIKNNYMKNQILETYTRTIKEDKYTLYPELEILLKGEELNNIDLSTYYENLKKDFFNKWVVFDEIEKDEKEIDLELNSIDKCKVGKITTNNIKFTIMKKQNNNNSIITNKLEIDDIEYSILSEKINRLNLVLTKYEIGEVSNYKINKLNKTKRLKL